MKKVVLMLAEGFEEIEALSVVNILRRAGVGCTTCSIKEKEVKGCHEITVLSDSTLLDLDLNDFDGIILPGGMPGSTNLKDCPEVIKAVQNFNLNKKLVSAICAAPIVLKEAGILNNKNVTSYPDALEESSEFTYVKKAVVVDGNIITSRGPATAPCFAFEILNYLGYSEEASALKEGMLYSEK